MIKCLIAIIGLVACSTPDTSPKKMYGPGVETHYYRLSFYDKPIGPGGNWRLFGKYEKQDDLSYSVWDDEAKDYKKEITARVVLMPIEQAMSEEEIYMSTSINARRYGLHVGDRDWCPLIEDGTQFVVSDGITTIRMVMVDIRNVRAIITITTPSDAKDKADEFLKMFHPGDYAHDFVH